MTTTYHISREDISREEIGSSDSTPNGYDARWIACINQVLEDRESPVTDDISEDLWDEFIGPMIDEIENQERFP
jgi:hypothetical protein